MGQQRTQRRDERPHARSRGQDGQGEQPHHSAPERLLAEAVGAFALTLVSGAGPVVTAVATGPTINLTGQMLAPGLVIMAMAYAFGDVSGAHFNPTVTLAFALRRDFPWRRLPGYWLAQGIGALVAALLLRWLFGLAGHVGATLPHHGSLAAVILEGAATFFLDIVTLATATKHRLIGYQAALAVGGTIALDGLFAAPISDASMNPARSFGPALAGGHLDTYWIYVVGPFAGMIVAVAVGWFLRLGTTAGAVEAASGK